MFPIVVFWEREEKKGMSKVKWWLRFAQEEAKYWVNMTLYSQVQITNSESIGTNRLCSLFSSLFTLKDTLYS